MADKRAREAGESPLTKRRTRSKSAGNTENIPVSSPIPSPVLGKKETGAIPKKPMVSFATPLQSNQQNVVGQTTSAISINTNNLLTQANVSSPTAPQQTTTASSIEKMDSGATNIGNISSGNITTQLPLTTANDENLIDKATTSMPMQQQQQQSNPAQTNKQCEYDWNVKHRHCKCFTIYRYTIK